MARKFVNNIILPILIGPVVGFVLFAAIAFSVRKLFNLDDCQREECVAIPGLFFGSIFGVAVLVYAFSLLKNQILTFVDRIALWAVTTLLTFMIIMCPLTLLMVPVSIVLNIYLLIKHGKDDEVKTILPLAQNAKEKLLMQQA